MGGGGKRGKITDSKCPSRENTCQEKGHGHTAGPHDASLQPPDYREYLNVCGMR